jgi:hypothetical protein
MELKPEMTMTLLYSIEEIQLVAVPQLSMLSWMRSLDRRSDSVEVVP